MTNNERTKQGNQEKRSRAQLSASRSSGSSNEVSSSSTSRSNEGDSAIVTNERPKAKRAKRTVEPIAQVLDNNVGGTTISGTYSFRSYFLTSVFPDESFIGPQQLPLPNLDADGEESPIVTVTEKRKQDMRGKNIWHKKAKRDEAVRSSF